LPGPLRSAAPLPPREWRTLILRQTLVHRVVVRFATVADREPWMKATAVGSSSPSVTDGIPVRDPLPGVDAPARNEGRASAARRFVRLLPAAAATVGQTWEHLDHSPQGRSQSCSSRGWIAGKSCAGWSQRGTGQRLAPSASFRSSPTARTRRRGPFESSTPVVAAIRHSGSPHLVRAR
jgi:hypothetical protein